MEWRWPQLEWRQVAYGNNWSGNNWRGRGYGYYAPYRYGYGYGVPLAYGAGAYPYYDDGCYQSVSVMTAYGPVVRRVWVCD